jgi:hypothetical protein
VSGRFNLVLVALAVTACNIEREEGEECQGSVVLEEHCADGLMCDDKAGWTCQPAPVSSSYHPSATPSTAHDDAGAAADAPSD